MNNDPQSNDATYHDQVDPITSDKRGRIIPRSNLRRLVIALDNALVEQTYRIRGDIIYADNNSTGVILTKLNNTSEDPFPLLALAGIVDMPFEDIFVTSNAQPGKVINIWYGYRARFLSPNQTIATIGSILNPVTVQGPNAMFAALSVSMQPVLVNDIGFTYGTSFGTFGAQTANTPIAIIAAASNLNGYEIHRVVLRSNTASSIAQMGLVAKATAPATPQDGDQLCMNDYQAINTVGPVFQDYAKLEKPLRVVAGKRLDYICDTLESASSHKAVLYTLF